MYHTYLRAFLLVGIILFTSTALQITPAYGQDVFAPNDEPFKAHATYTAREPAVDGRLTGPEWEQASLLTNFIQVEPRQGEPSEFRTEVRLLYSNEHLYVGVYCADPRGTEALRAPNLKRDFTWLQHDTFAIGLDGFNDKRNSITFATNPYGAQKDYLSFDAVLFDESWNGLWEVKTSRSDSGWVAEFEIPFKTLRYPVQTNKQQVWGINFVRLRRMSNEISAWSPYPRSFGFNRMEYAGVLEGLDVPDPSSNIQVNPYFLTRNDEMDDINSDNLRGTDFKPGGEIKWAVTPNTVIDFTANTDFAQAEADVQVNNVSRFSVLFPEKRSFFLENASLFGAGLTGIGDGTGGDMQILPFFSRRIGLDPAGNPIPINAGLRAVHRSVQRNAGILYMHQRPSDHTPGKHVAVGRYVQNIGKQNRLGILTTMSAASEDNEYVNWLGAVDGFFRLGEAHSVNTMVMQSGYTDDGSSGIAGYLQYLYTSNSVKAWWTQSVVSGQFNPELGFVSRENTIATTPGIFANLRGAWIPFRDVIRSFQPGVEMAWYHQASSRLLTERNVRFYPFWINLQNGGSAKYSVSWNYQNLTTDFFPLGIAIGEGAYTYSRHTFALNSDASRSLSYSLQHEFGSFYDGRLASTEINLTAAPIPHINLQLGFNRNTFRNVGVENTSEAINLYTVQSRLALNPQLQLTGLYQRNTQHGTDAFNIRFAWEYNPLSYIYLVFNSREFLNNNNLIQREINAIIKLTYLVQF